MLQKSPRVACGVGLTVCLVLAQCAGHGATAAAADESETSARSPADQTPAQASLPIILLTGFEPFGPDRPANSSWEGIKPLHGQVWKGYRLECREMRVEWGAPQMQLREWIDGLQPVAVFSFGQGATGSFALESVAANARGERQDNQGALPRDPKIISNGPTTLRASANLEQLRTLVQGEKYPVRISSNAGRYLCEETLYTLEYLRSTHTDQLRSVLFCHVPPLQSKVHDHRVNATFVQGFVERLLDAWVELQSPSSGDSPAVAHQKVAVSSDPETKAVESLIRHYFTTWSERNINAYGKCFQEGAIVQFIDPQGNLTTMALAPFLASQREAHANSKEPMVEVPESIDVRLEARLARAVVYWKLTSGTRISYGYDHFTLQKHQGAWRIIHLVFYGVEPNIKP